MRPLDEELDRRLHKADRSQALDVRGIELDEVLKNATSSGERSRVRRRVLGAGILAVSLGLSALAAPAAADAIRDWLAIAAWQPGLDGTVSSECSASEGCQILPGSEMVDLSAPDLAGYLATIYPDWLPLAPGTTKADLVDRLASILATEETTLTQEISLRSGFENLAYCSWVDLWLTTQDPEQRVTATDYMAEAAAWPATVQTDAGGVVPWLQVLAAAAANGDREGVEVAASMHGCDSADGADRQAWVLDHEPTW